MQEAVVCALIAGIVSVLGTWLSNRKSQAVFQAVFETKIEELSKYVEKHNQVIERTYALERKAGIIEEQVKVINHRISDLEAFHKP